MNATTATTGRAATPAGNGSETAPPALRRQTMQAIVQDTYGAADVWRAEQIARPEIAGNEVLVKIHAARLDRGTWHLMAGELTPVIDKTYPLHQAPGAMCHLEAGHAQGRLVITVTDAG
jgi:NADPH:quinone reductase-like Zn-dependent oxidoreductase